MQHRQIELPKTHWSVPEIEPCFFMEVEKKYFVIFGTLWVDQDDKYKAEGYEPDIYYTEIDDIAWKKSSVALPSSNFNMPKHVCLMNGDLYVMQKQNDNVVLLRLSEGSELVFKTANTNID